MKVDPTVNRYITRARWLHHDMNTLIVNKQRIPRVLEYGALFMFSWNNVSNHIAFSNNQHSPMIQVLERKENEKSVTPDQVYCGEDIRKNPTSITFWFQRTSSFYNRGNRRCLTVWCLDRVLTNLPKHFTLIGMRTTSSANLFKSATTFLRLRGHDLNTSMMMTYLWMVLWYKRLTNDHWP